MLPTDQKDDQVSLLPTANGWPVGGSSTMERSARELYEIAEGTDLRALCTHVAQMFVELFDLRWAEVTIARLPHAHPFSVRWTALEDSRPQRSERSISLPLGSRSERIGSIRIARSAGRISRMVRRDLVYFAEEALHCILYNALQPAKRGDSAVKAERLRLAAEIHHGIAQYVSSAITRLQLCQQCFVSEPTRAQEFLRTSLACAQIAMEAVRTTIHTLSNAEPNPPQLTTILQTTVDRLKVMTAAQFHLDIDLVRPLPRALVPPIAAVACEALTNAVKHAEARNISLSLAHRAVGITLEVVDDGKGFDGLARVPNERPWAGFGLSLMRDQVHQLGGTFQIHGVPTRGTRVMVQIDSGHSSSLELPTHN